MFLNKFQREVLPQSRTVEHPAHPRTPSLASPTSWRSSTRGRETPFKALAHSNSLKCPYELDMIKIESLPIPQFVNKGQVDEMKIQCRCSWFDIEKGTFFGKTWICQDEIDLFKNETSSSPDKRSQPLVKEEPIKKSEQQLNHKRRQKNEISSEQQLNQKRKQDESSEDESIISESVSDSQESTESTESEEEESCSESEVESVEKESQEKQFKTKYLQGHLFSGYLKSQNALFHTTNASPFIIIVIEIVLITANHHHQKYISLGWTYFYPFNVEKNGLDASELWAEDVSLPELRKSKGIAFYHGTPRVLPFVSSLLLASTSNFSALRAIPGASFVYRLFPRYDLRHICHLWPETVLIGPSDQIPGLDFYSMDDVRLAPSSQAHVSKVRVSFYPTIKKYEDPMLALVSKLYYEAHPDVMSPDEMGMYPPAEIIERKVTIGLHNGLTFIEQPFVTTLQPMFDDEFGDGFDLCFNGYLELTRFSKHASIPVVFVIEYKLKLVTNQASSPKKGAIGTIIEKLGGNPTMQIKCIEIEKDVCLGWGFWDTTNNYASEHPITLSIRFDSLNPSTSGSLVYTPLMYDDQDDSSQSSYDSEHPMATKSNPIVLSFEFSEQPGSPIKSRATTPRPESTKKLESAKTSWEQRMPSPQPTPIASNQSLGPPVAPAVEQQPIYHHQDMQQIEADESEEDLVSQEIIVVPPRESVGPAMPRFSQKQLISRSEKARLIKAGFEAVTDHQGHMISPLGPIEAKPIIDPLLELDDKLAVNQISLLFMGATFKTERAPQSLYFTFQFFNFPYTTSERLHVYTGPLPPLQRTSLAQLEHHRSTSAPGLSRTRMWSHQSALPTMNETMEQMWPGILYQYDGNDQPAFDSLPGFKLVYQVDLHSDDPTDIEIVDYLQHQNLHIDVWDGDSMLYLGSCSLNLKAALRQGKSGVAFEDDLDIVSDKYFDENGQIQTGENNYHQMNGTIHMRVSNVGYPSTNPTRQCTHPTFIVYDYTESLQHKVETISYPQKMSELEPELFDLLSKNNKKKIEKEVNEKKMEIVKKIKKENLSTNLNSKNGFGYQMSRQEKQRDLQTIQVFRDRKRRNYIVQGLKDEITTRHTIYPMFARSYYFEFYFTNPHNREQNFVITWNDQELRLVVDSSEWKYLRRIHDIRMGVEEKLIEPKPDGTAELFMLPNETVAIPFIFQSFQSGYRVITNDQDILKTMKKETTEEPIQPRTITVSFLNNKKVAVCLLDLLICPKNYYVHKVMRLFRSENENIRKSIRFSTNGIQSIAINQQSLVHDLQMPQKKYVKCSRKDVICSLNEGSANSNWKELSFKFRVAGAPETQALYFLLYHDPYCTSLCQVWRVVVHSLHRLDVNCVLGQTNTASLVLRGSSYTRLAECHTDHPQELMIMTPSPFTLTANVLNQVQLLMRPQDMQQKGMTLNIVDLQQKKLISSWLIVQHPNSPSITKTFDLCLPRGKHVNKRVTYTNPYSQNKTFYLKTNLPRLVQFKEELLNMDAGSTCYIGLLFPAVSHAGAVEILVFMNDETDKIEECLCLRVKYV